MADIRSHIDYINSSNFGAEIREHIIEVLTAIDNDGPDVKTFRGKRASDYMSVTELNNFIRSYSGYINKDDTPNKDSENPLMTKGIIKLTGLLSEYPL